MTTKNHVVRIQLRGMDADEYPPLYDALLKRNFERTIVGANGTYRLLRAMYRIVSDIDMLKVRALALAAMTEASVTGRVLVVEVGGMCWSGLERDAVAEDDALELLREAFKS